MPRSLGLGKRKSELVVIHIGTEKTGTTSIQNFLRKNSTALKRQNVWLVNRFGVPNNRDFVAFFQNTLDDWARQKGIRDSRQKDYYFRNFEKTFKSEMFFRSISTQQIQERHLLISSEHFSSRLTKINELQELNRFLKKYFRRVKIIAYFRPQENMAISLHSTGLRGESTTKLKDRLNGVNEENPYYNYYDLAMRWSSVFGKENMVFRIFDSKTMRESDVRYDFLDALSYVGLNLNTSKFYINPERSNESLSILRGSAFKAVNEVVPYWHSSPLLMSNAENMELKNKILGINSLARGEFPNRNIGEVQARFEESNEKFFREFMPGMKFEPFDTIGSEPEFLSIEEVELIVYELTKVLVRSRTSLRSRLLSRLGFFRNKLRRPLIDD